MQAKYLIGTYTDDTESQGVYALHLDANGCPHVDPEPAVAIRNPSFLVQHPFLDVVYAVSEVGQPVGGEVVVLCKGAANGFEVVQVLPSGGLDPCHLAVSADGRWLLVSHYSSGTVGLFMLGQDGQLTSAGLCVDHGERWEDRFGKSEHHPRQGASHVHSTQFVDDQQFLVCDLGTDEVVLYDLVTSGQAEVEARHVWRLPPGSGPRHAALTTDPLRIYVACELSNRVALLGLNSEEVPIIYDEQSCLPEQSSFSEASEIRFDAHHQLWVGNRGNDSLARFAPISDALGKFQLFDGCGRYPRHFWMNDQYLLVASRDDNCVTVASISTDGQPNLKSALRASIPAPVFVLPVIAR